MADIYRVKTTWTGMPGAPGVTTHYLNTVPGTTELAAIRGFFNALIAGLPNTLTLSVQGSGDIIDDATGALQGTWTSTAPSTVTGSSASGYGAPAGTLVHWLTSGIVAGRRVRGTTFIVPTVNQFEPGGTPLAAWVTTLTTAANSMISGLSAGLVVWSRPTTGSSARPGSSHVCSGVSVPDKAIVLRSRRD